MTRRHLVIVFIGTLLFTTSNAQGKDGANKRARRSLLPYTVTLGDATPVFEDFSKEGNPDDGAADFAKEMSDYDEAMKVLATVAARHKQQRQQEPRDEAKPK
ncbi:hypothetical protein MRX96_021709 [Rhipicephalus microplus]